MYRQNRSGRNSSVGISTRDGLDAPEIESRWGRYFRPRAHPTSCIRGTGSFPRVKQPERGVDHPLSSSAEFKERVQLPQFPVWAFMACSRVNFTITCDVKVGEVRFSRHYSVVFCRQRLSTLLVRTLRLRGLYRPIYWNYIFALRRWDFTTYESSNWRVISRKHG